MKKRICFFASLLCIVSMYSQNNGKGVVVDADTHEVLEWVEVYNRKDRTITNREGKYSFTSKLDSINFYKPGYHRESTTFSKIGDTLSLRPIPLELDEVVVTNAKGIFKKMMHSLTQNGEGQYLNRKFFLRAVQHTDDSIARIIDFEGKMRMGGQVHLNVGKLKKNDLKVEITNMRSIGIVAGPMGANLTMSSFGELLEILALQLKLDPKNYEMVVHEAENQEMTRFDFNNTSSKFVRKGHLLFDKETHSLQSFYKESSSPDVKYSQNKHLLYRTIGYEMAVTFKNIGEINTISNMKFEAELEFTNNEKTRFHKTKAVYLVSFYDDTKTETVKGNCNITKDIFKIRHPFKPGFWSAQNQLL
ncbi:MAG: hypothetical protein AB3N16_03420, partial [Flavobacteriaceae bacterium]